MSNFKSREYWQKRYEAGGCSGLGSSGHLLTYKANVLNTFIRDNDISSVIDFGCGDGKLSDRLGCPMYLGYDVSSAALLQCRKYNDGKCFFMIDEYRGESADLALSIDVIFHLTEDDVFEEYMLKLFGAADKYVILYTSNTDTNNGMAEHVRHRKVIDWLAENQPGWEMFNFLKNPYSFFDGDPNGSWCDFYFYKKREDN